MSRPRWAAGPVKAVLLSPCTGIRPILIGLSRKSDPGVGVGVDCLRVDDDMDPGSRRVRRPQAAWSRRGGELPIVTRPEGGPYMTDPARRPEVRSALMSRGIARTGPVARRFGDAYTSLGVE